MKRTLLTLTSADRHTIAAAINGKDGHITKVVYQTPWGIARRYAAIRAVADGAQLKTVARVLGVQAKHVAKWISAYRRFGLEGLERRKQPGPTVRHWLSQRKPYGHWTVLGQVGGRVQVRCVCGHKQWMVTQHLRNGRSEKCRQCGYTQRLPKRDQPAAD